MGWLCYKFNENLLKHINHELADNVGPNDNWDTS
jgi:hypothetical protein